MSGNSGQMRAIFRGIRVDTCVNPTMLVQKYPSGESFASNDDYGQDSRLADINALPAHLKPTNSLDAGILRELAPQYFTATLNSNTCQGKGLVAVDMIE
jgi:hypothetical protein